MSLIVLGAFRYADWEGLVRFPFRKLSACLVCSGLSFAIALFPEARRAIADFEVMFQDQSYDPGLPITEVDPADFSEVKAADWNGYFPSLWRWEETTLLAAVDGSKQPQDFGVNSNLGGQAAINVAFPVFEAWGVGVQAGSSIIGSSNASRIYELLGEETGRTQSFTTLGVFQRTESGFGWGFVHDFLYEKSFDSFLLGQWRLRGSYLLNPRNEVGVNAAFRSNSDTGVFGANTPVTLRSIDQGSVYLRHYWKMGAQTTGWFGFADEHGQNNALLGPSASKNNPFLFGGDILMPLTSSLAIYGETNIILPSDTGSVDAFLGIQWYPGGSVFRARRGRYSPMMSLASPTTFSVDLLQ